MFGFGHSLIVTSGKKGPKLNSSPVYFSGLKVFKFKGTFRPVCKTQATFMDQKLASELLQSKPDGTTLLTTREERLLIYFLVLPGLLYLRGFIYTLINLKDLKFFLLDMNMDQTFQF